MVSRWLQTGHAVPSVDQLRKLSLGKGIYPLLDVVVERADQPFVKAALADTDRRVAEGKPVAPSFLLACVLWQDVLGGWNARLAQGEHPSPRCRTPSTKCLTPASATCRAAASWAPTCARSG